MSLGYLHGIDTLLSSAQSSGSSSTFLVVLATWECRQASHSMQELWVVVELSSSPMVLDSSTGSAMSYSASGVEYGSLVWAESFDGVVLVAEASC